ncbi:hypothetical protein CDD81_6340 [Ophiocordyceps australis]|uniref:C2H2-type transcription factor MSN2 n=1 Tax=Ophiocordyceps australis TaxID=1399860 RepID=A0A2C5X9G8_9HYPO|nr:hypothetical protein CDD81_6340 [Ophiocordyceps australis]
MDSTALPPSIFLFNKQNGIVGQQHMGLYAPMRPLPSTPVYSRPTSSSCSQPPTLLSNGPSVMTSTSSLNNIKCTILLDSDFGDASYLPSTPPLSSSGSAMGSPKSFDVLQTPMNPMFSGLDGIGGGKPTLESVDVPMLDWHSCASPPMTPVYIQSQSHHPANNIGSLNGVTSEPSAASCPSLSPSPTPYARSIASENDVDFCDPRNLTVSSNPTLAPELDLEGLLSDAAPTESETPTADPVSLSQPSFDFSPVVAQGLPSFEDFSDLESDDDFGGLVSLGQRGTLDSAASRPRACTASSVVSLGHGSFISEEEFRFEDSETFQLGSLPSPPSSVGCSDDGRHQEKRQKKSDHQESRPNASPIVMAAPDSQSGPSQQRSEKATSVVSDSNASSNSDATSAPLPAPINRRGRKQSLTEDPSKTFVCDLCNRRFRRQEHLKRHYRSLHTQEKPFECGECGKKFSRSDNLAQHARTHGAGGVGMTENGDVSYDGAVPSGTISDDCSNFGRVLFQMAAEAPGSSSDASSEEGSDHGKKKRKRSD